MHVFVLSDSTSLFLVLTFAVAVRSQCFKISRNDSALEIFFVLKSCLMNLANQRVLALTSVLDTKVSIGLAKATLLGSPLGDDHTVGPGFVYT